MSGNLYERLSPVVQSLPPSGIRRFFDLATSMKDVISLGVGEPDFVTPWHVREACVDALERGHTSYTSNHGLLELRAEIARYLTRFGLAYDPQDEILVTVGASEAIDLALRVLLRPGDEVLIPEPAYVSYWPCAVLAGGRAVGVPTRPETEFRLTADALRARLTPKSKVLVLCFPNNPTGSVMSQAELAAVAQLCVEHDLFVVSDEIYAELTYADKHVSIASLPGMRERTVVIGGMSKAFAMTGWRIGYTVAPEAILRYMVRIHQYTIMCAPVMGQMAAIEALRHGEPEMRRMVQSYDQRRRLVVAGLRRIGLACHEPRGAFYAFPDIRATGLTSEEFAEGLLRESRVAVVPGNAFGAAGEGFVRCSYATSVEQLERALDRMEAFVRPLLVRSVMA